MPGILLALVVSVLQVSHRPLGRLGKTRIIRGAVASAPFFLAPPSTFLPLSKSLLDHGICCSMVVIQQSQVRFLG